jgi:1,4-dihydroxy-2-naphthoate octaprenyltransferase
MLLRFIAVISSSIATILSSLLPLFLYTSHSTGDLIFMLIFLSVAAIAVHGVLTHLFNDYTDFLSGTDAHSPAILSGGSRVIQEGMMQPQTVLKLGKWICISLLTIAAFMLLVGRYELAILIFIGIWSAVSYSLPPLQLSYLPFLGEWFSLFPAIFFIGVAGPWIIFGTVPLWAIQNAIINALVCMAWVMLHHIPDIDADRQAIPKKQTSVVWFVDTFGLSFARFPALLYVAMAGVYSIWIFPDRLLAGCLLICLLLIMCFLVLKINPKNDQQVTNTEKIMLLLAIIIAVVLGVF